VGGGVWVRAHIVKKKTGRVDGKKERGSGEKNPYDYGGREGWKNTLDRVPVKYNNNILAYRLILFYISRAFGISAVYSNES